MSDGQPHAYLASFVTVKSAIHTVPVCSPTLKTIKFWAARPFARNSYWYESQSLVNGTALSRPMPSQFGSAICP